MKKSGVLSKAVADGILAGLGLLSFYFLTLRFANGSWIGAFDQFGQRWVWIALLDWSFGVQVGLYRYLRQILKDSLSGKIATGSGGFSTLGMIACCAHHLSDILPVVGLSGAFLFLGQYQDWFLALGLASNTLGTAYLIKHLRMIKFEKVVSGV